MPGAGMILFSAVKDKDYEDMISCLCRDVQADFYVVTLIADNRAAAGARIWDGCFRKIYRETCYGDGDM